MASILFKNALSRMVAVPARRSIVTTPVRRSADPLIGHIEQEAMPGAVCVFFSYISESNSS